MFSFRFLFISCLIVLIDLIPLIHLFSLKSVKNYLSSFKKCHCTFMFSFSFIVEGFLGLVLLVTSLTFFDNWFYLSFIMSIVVTLFLIVFSKIHIVLSFVNPCVFCIICYVFHFHFQCHILFFNSFYFINNFCI